MTGTFARLPFRIWLTASALLLATFACACDIPVYEYTLQNWLRDAYEASYFYSVAEAARDVPVNMHLQRAGEGGGFHANLALRKIDVAGGGAGANQIPPRHSSRRLPFHTVTTPGGTELFAGRLDLADAKALVQSPQRKQLARELCAGKNGVLLILLGSDRAQNAIAKKTVSRVIAGARNEEHLEVGMLQVGRDDTEEKWFVRQLLSLEDDLKQLDDTMVFGVFGRGHVMEPYLGKGITEQNIKAIVDFITGPCACEIKTSSAGMDMLTSWDWDSGVADHTPAQERPMRSALFDVAADKEPATSPQPPAAAPTSAKQDTGQDHPSRHPATKRPAAPNAAINSKQPPTESITRPQQDPQQQAETGDIPPTIPKPATVSPEPRPEDRPVSAIIQQQPDAAPHASPDEDVAIGEGPGLTKLLSARLGAILAAATVLLLAASLVIVWRRRSQ